MKVLLIAFEFPPCNSGGSHRPFKQALELQRRGIKPIVLTPDPEAFPASRIDRSMEGPDLDSLTIVRSGIKPLPAWKKLFASSLFNGIDTAVDRCMERMLVAVEYIRSEHRIDAVLLTAPPFSMVEVGSAAARKLGVPLILDLRDAWSQWGVSPYPSRLHYGLVRRKERRALMEADAIIATSEQTIADLQKLYPDMPHGKFHLVTNAFEGPLPQLPDTLPIRPASVDRPLVIGYLGSFYYQPHLRAMMFTPWWKKRPHQWFQFAPRQEDWLYRTPWYLLQALAELREQRRAVKDLVRLIIVGDRPQWLSSMIERLGLQDMVELKPRMEHAAALAFQQGCDLLLSTSSKVIGGRDYSISGKTFEYLQTGKPILAFVCEGAQKDLLERTGMAVICPPDDLNGSVRTLARLIDGELSLRPDKAAVADYHLSATGTRLEAVIRQVVSQRTSASSTLA
ncbi:MAG: glycosyltransferase family 4 protein [Flavobacteriales bacterium]|nr:glycosyltransferase family 4 protein [Flavobacteriales bacterium]